MGETRRCDDGNEPLEGHSLDIGIPRFTHRVFLLGAGFSKPAGLPLASELLDRVRDVARRCLSTPDGYNHLEADLERYEMYLADTEPSRPFDLEEFGAWLDWEHVLRLRGSDTWSDEGNRSSLQLRWAIGHVLYRATPTVVPPAYLEFAKRLTTSDLVLTLNYDLLLERALDEVGLPYRRFPHRYSEVFEMHASIDSDHPPELVIAKLHGSLDWVNRPPRKESNLPVHPLVHGPRFPDDPLRSIGVVPTLALEGLYGDANNWWRSPPLIVNPSTAKPLARSALVPLWDGLLQSAGLHGNFVVIGCSLPAGDPYVRQVAHTFATEIGGSLDRKEELPWPQGRMKVVDYRNGRVAINELRERYRFMPTGHTDFVLDGFALESLDQILSPRG